ncbi:uncharacterized protein N7506_000161, partial [Penicillium brevicompactum]|uniref:uncharacterized protein n=1 Tax=Penicillium brevicompactum TaxID=5074 RepID=UPI00254141FE
MTPPDNSSTESRMHTLFADFQKPIETSDRARVSAEPRVPSQKIPRSIPKNRERTSPRRDRPEHGQLKRVRFEPASGVPLKESVLSGAHTPEKSIASWSVFFLVAPSPPIISTPVLLLIYYAGRAGEKGHFAEKLNYTNDKVVATEEIPLKVWRKKVILKPSERKSRASKGNWKPCDPADRMLAAANKTNTDICKAPPEV